MLFIMFLRENGTTYAKSTTFFSANLLSQIMLIGMQIRLFITVLYFKTEPVSSREDYSYFLHHIKACVTSKSHAKESFEYVPDISNATQKLTHNSL